MDKKTTGLVATIAAALLCGCPGLIGLCFGTTSVLASMMPGSDVDVFGSNNPAAGTAMGFAFLCLSIIFIAIPVVVGVLTLRKQPGEGDEVPPAPAAPDAPAVPAAPATPETPAEPEDKEPLPPAS